MNIVDEAKELIPWLDEDSLVTRMAKHIEYLRLKIDKLEDALKKIKSITSVNWVEDMDKHDTDINEIIKKALGGE